jgi:hypothetical protein
MCVVMETMRSMNSSSLIAFAGLLAAGSGHVQAEPNYRCTVQSVALSAAPMSAGGLKLEQDMLVGSTFTVDRRTGVIGGSPVLNTGDQQPEVVDPGSSSPATSFIALTVARRSDDVRRKNSHVNLLMIAEYAKPQEKPFHLVSSLFSYRGSCVHVPANP